MLFQLVTATLTIPRSFTAEEYEVAKDGLISYVVCWNGQEPTNSAPATFVEEEKDGLVLLHFDEHEPIECQEDEVLVQVYSNEINEEMIYSMNEHVMDCPEDLAALNSTTADGRTNSTANSTANNQTATNATDTTVADTGKKYEGIRAMTEMEDKRFVEFIKVTRQEYEALENQTIVSIVFTLMANPDIIDYVDQMMTETVTLDKRQEASCIKGGYIPLDFASVHGEQ